MKLNNETQIGIFVTIVIAALFVLTLKTGDFNFGKKGYNIKVVFPSIDGIELNAPVMLSGYEVGLVKDIQFKYDMETVMVLDVWLSEDARLRDGAKAFVRNMGFMGEKYVALTSGVEGQPYLMPDAVIRGTAPTSLDAIMTDGKVIAENLKGITANLNERLDKNEEAIDRIIANFDRSMDKISSIADNIDERLNVNEEHIDETLAHFHSMSVNLDEFAYDLKLNPWKLMYRPKKHKEDD